MEKYKYKYFISYRFETGSGRTVWATDKKVSYSNLESWLDIIEASINKSNGIQCHITNFIEFEDENRVKQDAR